MLDLIKAAVFEFVEYILIIVQFDENVYLRHIVSDFILSSIINYTIERMYAKEIVACFVLKLKTGQTVNFIS